MHDAMVEPLLVPDGEVLRVFHDGEGEADKTWRNQQLLICPETENQLISYLSCNRKSAEF